MAAVEDASMKAHTQSFHPTTHQSMLAAVTDASASGRSASGGRRPSLGPTAAPRPIARHESESGEWVIREPTAPAGGGGSGRGKDRAGIAPAPAAPPPRRAPGIMIEVQDISASGRSGSPDSRQPT